LTHTVYTFIRHEDDYNSSNKSSIGYKRSSTNRKFFPSLWTAISLQVQTCRTDFAYATWKMAC